MDLQGMNVWRWQLSWRQGWNESDKGILRCVQGSLCKYENTMNVVKLCTSVASKPLVTPVSIVVDRKHIIEHHDTQSVTGYSTVQHTLGKDSTIFLSSKRHKGTKIVHVRASSPMCIFTLSDSCGVDIL